MLESAEVGHKVAKATFQRAETRLREALLRGQYEMGAEKRGPILVLISGLEGGGRGETANKLNEWMDPRFIRTSAFGPGAPEEEARPLAWRYWRALPPRGTVGVFMNAWYRKLVNAYVQSDVTEAEFNAKLQDIRQYEQMLTDEGIVLLKFWIHLSKEGQKQRLHELKSNPKTAWRVTSVDRRGLKHYHRYHDVWEQMLRETSIGAAPWYVVEGTDSNYRNLTVGKILEEAMVRVNAGAKPVPRVVVAPAPSVIGNVALIRRLDLSQKLDENTYDRELAKWQSKLAALTQRKEFRHRSLILAFEGSDAAGKGGAIRRVATSFDAHQFVIVPIAAPTEEELAQPFLWRFWRQIPARGGIAIFDRTWYGRVLVERVEGYCSVADWMRAYDEINQFEEQLVHAGSVICKFWLQISKEEQLKRFKAREKTAFKQFKITPDDWRNRKKWHAYEQAVADMVDRTSTELAPWTLVEAEDKYFARAKVLKTIAKRLERALAD
ncbi:MAG: polyphosphate:AMP phosphotransferase [Betaproteobacteria bacterium]